MELALSLGDASKPFSGFLNKSVEISSKDLGVCMGLGGGFAGKSGEKEENRDEYDTRVSSDSRSPVQLDLLPFSPVPRSQPKTQLRFPWLTNNLISEPGSTDIHGRGFDVNRFPVTVAEEAEDGTTPLSSSPNSTVSSFQMEFYIKNGNNISSSSNKRDLEIEIHERASSRPSDDEDNGLTRKKLRLSKEQSAFLEETFKEHSTLNPKQKLALAKQLRLRPRQVEVWFQNRRARTKLKQTEVDCEYLKRCCETLTEENRRLQRELQELRALKTSQPFYMQLPATTLTMCPSCERVATTTAAGTINDAAIAAGNGNSDNNLSISLQLAKPGLFPFAQVQQPQASRSAS